MKGPGKTNDRDSVKVYSLSYPTQFGASSGTEIFFDPITHLVPC
jgi:hypothetical protein